MLIGHFSDIHGRISLIDNSVSPDLWICSGDFFPNKTRGIKTIEAEFQRAWFVQNLSTILDRLGDAPLLFIGGNHDYVDLAALLVEFAGYDAQTITTKGVEHGGYLFAGFREIPYIQGEWNGETRVSDLSKLCGEVFDSNPDVLVTHAPPAGILDVDDGAHGGISPLTNMLTYTDHKVKAHFFGHVHEKGGMSTEKVGVKFYNGANHTLFHKL